ncbi:alcohol dehydrogenase catalytic domain-containing protein [Streptomyces paromomycinus]|uniref:Sorbitol dehydrogenase n=1 Tax=Streptomyces paromomycinus TaxID=92743 RepID=A0A401W9J8_STREY|nr:alcohol dehydrogenase catalytic domain-containing protein [Streptomyces paromomycinus]GCD45994.1 sorbitol dehydrogenase [Streptomyces paromomycinus]
MTTHRAVVRQGGASRVQARPTPDPGPGEVLLAPEAVSLCGTDIQMLRGLRDDPSPVLGHEGACQVVAVGAGVTRVRPGDRVVVNPTHPGDPSFLLGHNVDGLFQQRVLIAASAVEAGLLVPIGDALGSHEATLVEPLAVVDYAWHCLDLAPGEELVVVGDGLIGNLAAERARHLFEDVRVTLVHTSDAGLAWSERHLDPAIRHVRWQDLCPGEGDPPAHVLIATHRDRTVDAVDLAHERLGSSLRAFHVIGGVYGGAAGRHYPGVDLSGVRAANTGGPLPPRRVTWSGGTGPGVRFTGNRGVTGAALAAAAGELTRRPDRYRRLLTHRRALESGTELMNRLVDGGRLVDGELVVRLVVEMNTDLLKADA